MTHEQKLNWGKAVHFNNTDDNAKYRLLTVDCFSNFDKVVPYVRVNCNGLSSDQIVMLDTGSPILWFNSPSPFRPNGRPTGSQEFIYGSSVVSGETYTESVTLKLHHAMTCTALAATRNTSPALLGLFGCCQSSQTLPQLFEQNNLPRWFAVSAGAPISTSLSKVGQLMFGRIDDSYYEGDLLWVNTLPMGEKERTFPQKKSKLTGDVPTFTNWWQFQLTGVEINGHRQNGSAQAIVDTGTSEILLSESALNATGLRPYLGRYLDRHELPTDMPTLIFHVAGGTITIGPDVYVLQKAGGKFQIVLDSAGIIGIPEGFFVLGAPYYFKYFTVHSFEDGGKIGLAPRGREDF